MEKKSKSLVNFHIGADPEFVICNSYNSQIDADGYGGCSEDLGCDGDGSTFEARPKPAKNPITVVNNIHGIFSKAIFCNPELASYTWKAGSSHNGRGIGGHIHFGLPSHILERTTNYNYNCYSSILSDYVGALTLLVEDEIESNARRGSHGYGGQQDYRAQDYGFEYRTPSSWLVSPYVSAATLCLAKVVMSEILNNDKLKNKDLAELRFDYTDFRDTHKSKFRAQFPAIWKDIQQMALYPRYRRYIDIFHMLITNKKTWFPKCTMKEAWGLADLGVFNKKISVGNLWAGVSTK